MRLLRTFSVLPSKARFAGFPWVSIATLTYVKLICVTSPRHSESRLRCERALAPDAWGTEVRRKGARARRARRVDVFCGWIHHDSRPRFAMDPPAGDTLGA